MDMAWIKTPMEEFTSNISNSSNQTDEDLLNHRQMQIIGYIDLSASFLSLCGASSILIHIVYKRNFYSLHEIQPILNLSLADWLASLFLMVCCILYLSTEASMQHRQICMFLSGITMVFYCNTFFLTLCYAGEVLIKLRLLMLRITPRDVIPRSIRITRICMYAVSWLLPVFGGILLVCLINGEISTSFSNPNQSYPIIPVEHDCSTCIPLFHYKEDICWEWGSTVLFQLRMAAKYFFMIPLIVTFIGNFVIYFFALKLVPKIQMKRGSITSQEYEEKQMTRNKAILYQIVFLMCWLPSLLLGLISMTDSFSMRRYFPIFVIQALTAPLQGFFNSFIYGWKKEGFRRPHRSSSDTLLVSPYPSSNYRSI